MNRIYDALSIRRALQQHGRSQQQSAFDPKINRHTGAPHLHQREIARNQRRAIA